MKARATRTRRTSKAEKAPSTSKKKRSRAVGVFDYSLNFRHVDFRKHPEQYRIGRGEQGVLLVEPYKSEILPHWRFKTLGEAKRSSRMIYNLFIRYLRQGDFVGADMAKKFLQMGWTRARRYANHRSGNKYDRVTGVALPRQSDSQKAKAAELFYERYSKARGNRTYKKLKQRRQKIHE